MLFRPTPQLVGFCFELANYQVGGLPGFPSNTIRRRVDSRQVEPRGVGGAEEEDLLSFSSKKFDFKQLESVLGGVDSPSWVTPPC